MGNKIGYYFFNAFLYFLKIIPFKIIYLISDGVYLLLYYIIGYRKSVVRKNIDKCFPEKSLKEKKQIERNFYKNLADLILESLKGYTISKEEAIKRIKIKNPELLNQYYENNKSVIIAFGHIGNWEMAFASIKHYLKHQPIVLYKPLSNTYINKLIKEKRERFGSTLLSIKQKLSFSSFEKKPMAIYMLADQYATGKRKALANFFNSETSFLFGIEFFAKRYDYPVIYANLKKVKRGFYEAEFSLITENPKKTQQNEITQKYATLLEQSIRQQPEIWMWSHKRWKNEGIY